MIKKNRITIEDILKCTLHFEYDEGPEPSFSVFDGSDTQILEISMEDAEVLVRFFREFGVSA